MGDRGNIKMLYGDNQPIYLYTHWSGYNLPQTLAAALERGQDRWNDDAYLARIIFCEMVQGYERETTGFGIAPFVCDNEYPILAVDCDRQTVQRLSKELVAGARKTEQSWTFIEFIEQHKKE